MGVSSVTAGRRAAIGHGGGPPTLPRSGEDDRSRQSPVPLPDSVPGGMAPAQRYTTGMQWIRTVLRYHAMMKVSLYSFWDSSHLSHAATISHSQSAVTTVSDKVLIKCLVQVYVRPTGIHPSWDRTCTVLHFVL